MHFVENTTELGDKQRYYHTCIDRAKYFPARDQGSDQKDLDEMSNGQTELKSYNLQQIMFT